MSKIKCSRCKETLEPWENYLLLNDEEVFCERCFFDYAVKQLKAKERQLDYNGESTDTDEEDG